MQLFRLVFGGALIGLAFGMLIGAYLAEGKEHVNYTSIAGVGSILAVCGGASIRASAIKS
jgi:hypothetical protein